MAMLGDTDGALRLYRQALGTLRRTLGEDNPDVAQTYASIAAVLKKRGQDAEALESMQLAVAVAKRGLPEGHASRKRFEVLAEKMERQVAVSAQDMPEHKEEHIESLML